MAIKESPAETGEIDSSVPISKDTPDNQYNRLKAWYIEDYKANSLWYSEAREDFAFESGDQWSEEDKEKDRLSVVFNRIKPTVDVICGMEVTNRQEVQFIPRTTSPAFPMLDPKTQQPIPPPEGADDAEVTEGYTEVTRWSRDNCDAEDEESDSFRDDVICGMGWTETSMDYETEPEGRIVIDRRDPMQMGWDCAATKRNLDDAKRFHRTMSDISKQDAKAAFPKFDEGDLHAGFALESQFSEGGIAHDREKARNYENRNITEQRTKVTQVVIEWCEVESQNQVYNPADGTTFIETDEGLKKLQERVKQLQAERDTQVKAMGAPPMGDTGQSMGAVPEGMPAPEMPPEIPDVISAPVKKRCWYRATLGAKVLELKKAPCDFSSAFKCMTGYRDRNKKQWYGIVRPMRDPQRWANKFFSVALEQIAKSGKGLLAEQGAFVDDRKAEKEWARNNITFLKTGKINSVLPKPQPPMLTGLSELMQLSLQAIRDVTGVNQETIGMADRDQAASLEYQRRQAGVTILAALFDNLRRYRKEQGRVHLYFIQNYISDGRLIRILGENGTPKLIQLMRQPDTIQYDVIVDQAPSSPNQKEAAWMVTKDIIPIMLQNGAGPSVMAELFKMSPMPESNVQRLRRANERDEQQRAQQGPSIEQQKLQAETQKLQADGQKSQADTALKTQEMQLRKHEVDMTTALGMQQLQQSAEQQQVEMQKSQLEFQKASLDLEKQREANALTREQMAFDHAKFMADAQMKIEESRAKAGERLLQDINQVIQMAEVKIDSKLQKSSSDGAKAEASASVNQSKAEVESLRSDMQEQIKALIEQLGKPKTAKFSADGMSATIQ